MATGLVANGAVRADCFGLHSAAPRPCTSKNSSELAAIETKYFGHRIRIEPYEWGYIAEITAPASTRSVLAASSSAMGVLERAFDYIDNPAGPIGTHRS